MQDILKAKPYLISLFTSILFLLSSCEIAKITDFKIKVDKEKYYTFLRIEKDPIDTVGKFKAIFSKQVDKLITKCDSLGIEMNVDYSWDSTSLTLTSKTIGVRKTKFFFDLINSYEIQGKSQEYDRQPFLQINLVHTSIQPDSVKISIGYFAKVIPRIVLEHSDRVSGKFIYDKAEINFTKGNNQGIFSPKKKAEDLKSEIFEIAMSVPLKDDPIPANLAWSFSQLNLDFMRDMSHPFWAWFFGLIGAIGVFFGFYIHYSSKSDRNRDDLQRNSLSTSSNGVLILDNVIYKTIKIGKQEWMIENLRVTRNQSGNNKAIKRIKNKEKWAQQKINLRKTPAFCALNFNDSYTQNYGYLYNAYAITHPDFAPSDWRIPSKADFDKLIQRFGDYNSAIDFLKDQTWGGNNTSGFSALPSKYVTDEGNSTLGIDCSCFYLSDAIINDKALHYHFHDRNDGHNITAAHNPMIELILICANEGYSVRLMRDVDL